MQHMPDELHMGKVRIHFVPPDLAVLIEVFCMCCISYLSNSQRLLKNRADRAAFLHNSG